MNGWSLIEQFVKAVWKAKKGPDTEYTNVTNRIEVVWANQPHSTLTHFFPRKSPVLLRWQDMPAFNQLHLLFKEQKAKSTWYSVLASTPFFVYEAHTNWQQNVV